MSLIQTLRKPRIYGFALFDLLTSIIATEFIFRQLGSDKWIGASLAIPIGIIVHLFLGINTTLNYKLGLSEPVKNN
jgi:hypothetical protein